MSTRSVVARVGEHEGQFAGRYVHSDGMPTSMGPTLWHLLHGHFRNDLAAMLAYLIDAPHAQCGWSSIAGADFALKPGYTLQKATADGASYEVYSKRADYRRPQCFAGRPGETPHLLTESSLGDTNIEWLYVFDEAERKLFVRDVAAKEDVAVIELDGTQPDWAVVECGEDFGRCSHYAWFHRLTPPTSNLSTQTWLGKRPLEFRDAVAFIVDGKRYKATGSGGDSDYLRRTSGANFPAGCWVSSVVAGNGRRLDIPTARATEDGYTPILGVARVYPATKDNPQERLVTL